VERFNRTLKEMMWKRFTAENTRRWIDMLDKLLREYNTRRHSTIGMTPMKASLKENEMKVLQNIINKTKGASRNKPKFKVGDRVRMSRTKALFEKGYLPNWSEETYIVGEVQKTNPITYKIKDSLGEIIEGSFYNEELQKTKQEIYRIEKVIRKKKIDGVEHALVKWSGYSKKYNQWIPVSELEKIT
jgi:Chromo (CHRromatin Organisation MOdifier) domain